MAKKIGRPSKYSKEVADKICSLIATSDKGLHSHCSENDDLPCFSTVMLWLSNPDYKYFSDNYARAREKQADYLADQIIELSKKERRSTTVTTVDDDSVTETEFDNHARTRLIIDAYKWKASKLAPKKYGDKLEIDGSNIPAPMMNLVITPASQVKKDDSK